MQNQACTHNVPSTSDPVAAKIASYRPTTLTDAQCAAWLPRVRELVSATPPADLQDALQMLTAACRFLADTDAPIDRPVDEILTVDAIAMWATRALRSALTRESVRLYTAWLRRIWRVSRGGSGRLERGVRDHTPGDVLDVAGVVDLCDLVAAELAVLVIAAAGAGCDPRTCEGAVIDGDAVVDRAGVRHRIASPLVALADMYVDVPAGRWSDATADLSAAGFPVTWTELVAAFDVFVVTGTHPVDALDGFGLGRRRVDRAVEAAPERPAEAVTRVLHTVSPRPRLQTTGPVVEPEEVEPVAPTLSAAQMRREMAEVVRAAAVPITPLSEEQQRLVTGYRPQQVPADCWARVRDTHIAAMQNCAELSVSGFSQTLTIVAKFLLWLDSRHADTSPRAAFTLEAINAFCEFGLDNNPASTKQTYRTRLAPLVTAFNPATTPMPTFTAGAYQPNRPCYQPFEIEQIRKVAVRQSGRVTRRKLCGVVGFGAGGGLGATDMRPLMPSHVEEDRGVIGVNIVGDKPRFTVIRSGYEDLVRIALDGVGKNTLVFGTLGTRKNIFGNLFANAELFDDTPKIETSRLRATWLADLMWSGVPVDVILNAAGLLSARPLVDLLPYLPARDAATTARLLNGGAS
jgi:hypothetical protein